MILNINKTSIEEQPNYDDYIEHRSEMIFLSAKVVMEDDIKIDSAKNNRSSCYRSVYHLKNLSLITHLHNKKCNSNSHCKIKKK